MAVLAYKVVQP